MCPEVSWLGQLRFFPVLAKIRKVVQDQFTQGLSPGACAAAIASSLTIGVFPIMGFSTPMNALSALAFRLNQPVVQAFNWIMGPVKIALIVPFLRFGEWLYGAEPFTLSLKEFSAIFFADWWATTCAFAWTFVHAITGWLVVAPMIYLVIYIVSSAVVRRRSRSDLDPSASGHRRQKTA